MILYIYIFKVHPDMMSLHPEFFASVNDKPLHLIFKVRKPHKQSDNESFPKKILWYPYEIKNPTQLLEMSIPLEVENQLTTVVNRLADQGFTAENFDWSTTEILLTDELNLVHKFGVSIRSKLLDETGAALVRKLNLNNFQQEGNSYDDMANRAKLAYYILCCFIGDVDNSARGRLFDVRDSKFNVLNDNVLFSVSNSEAGWHTDGASREHVYDVVSLLSLSKAKKGGEFKIANAVNAFENLKLKLPKFLLYELMRAIPRDILESGQGKGTSLDILSALTRGGSFMSLRLKRNAFPIFVDRGNRMRFRYMRYWIETAHRKIGWNISPLLVIAMDALDKELDSVCCFEESLEPGDMVFSNNMIIAHARNSFEDVPGDIPRHKVRAWIQIQHVHLS